MPNAAKVSYPPEVSISAMQRFNISGGKLAFTANTSQSCLKPNAAVGSDLKIRFKALLAARTFP